MRQLIFPTLDFFIYCSIRFLTEDGLFDMIQKSKPAKAAVHGDRKNYLEKAEKSPVKSSIVGVKKRGKLEVSKNLKFWSLKTRIYSLCCYSV